MDACKHASEGNILFAPDSCIVALDGSTLR